MAIDPLSPKAHGFQPFILAERYVDVVCDLEGYDGFQVSVRMNLTNGQRETLQAELIARSAEFSEDFQKRQFELKEINSLAEKAKAENDTAAAERLAARSTEIANQFNQMNADAGRFNEELVAPYVHRWNVYTTGPDGEPVEVPPPATGGVASFDHIDGPMFDWILRTLLDAYRGGKGFRSLLTNAAAKQGPGTLPIGDVSKGTPQSNTQRSRRSSALPEA